MRIPGICVAMLLVAPVAAAAQSDRVDQFIHAQMQQQRIPALSLAVIRNGEIIKAQGYGVTNLQSKTAATAETVFWIASTGKQFIATAIMLLVQDGKLRLDEPITKFLTDAPRTWGGITIRHLLTHTSGLAREAPAFDPYKPQPDRDVIRSAYALPLQFQPGEKWEYSNVGYFTLGEVIRVVSGMPWTQFMHERIFKPLGMAATVPTNAFASVPNRVTGYTDNDRLEEVRPWTALRPSGPLLSNVLDMAKWDAVLYTDRILADSTRRQMWTPVTLNNGSTYGYGFGWQVQTYQGRRLIQHGGGGPGARAKFARFVDDGLTIVILSSLDDIDIDEIMNGVAKLYLPGNGPSVRTEWPNEASGSRACRAGR